MGSDHVQSSSLAMSASPGVSIALRYGVAEDQGRRSSMEDAWTAVADMNKEMPLPGELPDCRAFFGVFDGHGGADAAHFACNNMLSYMVSHESFPESIPVAMRAAFLQADSEYYKRWQMSREAGTSHESGTTALAAVVWGRKLYLANAGDSRAVLCNRGRAVELTRDHKPCSEFERQRIEQAGGYVCPEGLLNGELGVARAIGDYHFPGAKSLPPPGPDNAAADGGGANGGGAAHRPGPLSAEPETLEHLIAPEDEFLLLGCDGLWDVFPSQRAVEFARGRLREHNDVSRLAQELVQEALRMHTSDNVTVIAVCFGGEPPPARTYTAPFQRNISRDGLNRLASFLQP